MRLEELGSRIWDNQFIFYVLNSKTAADDLQLAMMEKRENDKSNLLNTDEIRDDLNLSFF
jgi:hypothetical protein